MLILKFGEGLLNVHVPAAKVSSRWPVLLLEVRRTRLLYQVVMAESHALCGNGMGEVLTDAKKSRDGWRFFCCSIVVGVFNET